MSIISRFRRGGERQAHATAYRDPLFDLLTAEPAIARRGEPERDRLLRSLRRELTHLLNARRANGAMLDAETATTLDYGIPNFSPRSTTVQEELNELGALMANAISIFEPRLISPRVTVGAEEGSPGRAQVEISGSIRVGSALERFTFALDMDEGTLLTEAPAEAI